MLGTDWYLSDSLFATLEGIRNIYGKNKKDIDKFRYESFKDIYEKKWKVQNLSLRLSPCKQALKLHCKRANYIVEIWKSGFILEVENGSIDDNDSSGKGEVVWTETSLPEDVTEILEDNDDTEEGFDDEDSSDEEDWDMI